MKLKLPKAKPGLIPFVGILIALYIFSKAGISSFTHDESYSYLHYPHDSFIKIISFSNWFMNNHILNSLFMKYSEQLWGNSEFALRLPNLFLMVVYMFYSYRLFQNKNSILSVAIFCILCTNVLMMDLFGLARGYGLSFGFMLMSLYHFLAYLKKNKKVDLAVFHFAALLAVLSHFTLLLAYISLLLLFNVVKILESRFGGAEKFHLFKTNKPNIIPILLNTIILYEPLRRAISYGDFSVGGKSGFYSDTVTHFIYNIFDGIEISSPILFVLQVLFTFIIVIPLFIIVKNISERKTVFIYNHKGLIVTNFLLLIISIILILQHLILRTDYPIDRFSIFLFPIFSIHFGFFINYLIETSYKKTILVITSFIALAAIINFGKRADLHASAGWTYDSETKNMIQTLISTRKMNNDNSKNIRLSVNWLFEPTINFYRITKGLDWLLPIDRNSAGKTDDYYYIFENEPCPLSASEYEIIKKFENTKTILIKHKTASD